MFRVFNMLQTCYKCVWNYSDQRAKKKTKTIRFPSLLGTFLIQTRNFFTFLFWRFRYFVTYSLALRPIFLSHTHAHTHLENKSLTCQHVITFVLKWSRPDEPGAPPAVSNKMICWCIVLVLLSVHPSDLVWQKQTWTSLQKHLRTRTYRSTTNYKD